MPFIAGTDDEGEPVIESLEVELVDTAENFVRLTKSPLFVRNLAAGDKLRVLNPAGAEYELVQRSGNLCIRVFRKHHLASLADFLTPEIEKLGGKLDLQADRALVYSIHFSIGFSVIEELLNKACTDYPDTIWYYGNVYDPEDGVTPLLWWQDMEQQN